MHLTEEDLVLYRYEESPDAAAVETHLSTCARCRGELDALSRVLAAVDEPPSRDPGVDYGRSVWAAIAPRLDRAESSSIRRLWARDWRWLIPQAALASSIAALLIAGFPFEQTSPARDSTLADAGVAKQQGHETSRVLLTAVRDHLERADMMLTELNNATGPDEVRISQESARELTTDNRLYRQSATLAGDKGIESLLDALERVLIELSHTEEGTALDQLRSRLDTHGMAFKLRMTEAGLRERDLASAADDTDVRRKPTRAL
jgi:hypothetical protein